MFMTVATEELKLVCVFFLLGHFYRFPRADPASACESDLYQRVAVAPYFLFVTTVSAIMVLVTVRLKLQDAEADSLAPGADADAAVPAGWERATLRGKLLFAVGLSAAVSFLAIVAFDDGYRYRRGCADGSSFPSPLAVVLMVFMALLHGFFAWVAVWKD